MRLSRHGGPEAVRLFDLALTREALATLWPNPAPRRMDRALRNDALPEEDAPMPLRQQRAQLTNGAVVVKYYYLNGQRVAEQRGGVWRWIHSDHLSSASVITDRTGAAIRWLAYAPFGAERRNSGPGAAPTYSYTGKERDAGSGLLYYGARYYDPILARFITPDTVYDTGSQGLNRYSYALNNPIRYTDPTGHLTIVGEAALIGAAASAITGAAIGYFSTPEGQEVAETIVGPFVRFPSNVANVAGQVWDFFVPPSDIPDTSQESLPITEPGPSTIVNVPPETSNLWQPESIPANSCPMDPEQILPSDTPDTSFEILPITEVLPNVLNRTLDDPLPANPKKPTQANPHAPDLNAIGSHTVIGTRTDPKRSPQPYRQGITYDANGKPVGRTDVTDHGRGDHANPHWHPYDPNIPNRFDPDNPGNFGPAEPMPF